MFPVAFYSIFKPSTLAPTRIDRLIGIVMELTFIVLQKSHRSSLFVAGLAHRVHTHSPRNGITLPLLAENWSRARSVTIQPPFIPSAAYTIGSKPPGYDD